MIALGCGQYMHPPEWDVGDVTYFGNWEQISALPSSFTRWRFIDPDYSFDHDHYWNFSGSYVTGSGWYYDDVWGFYATAAEAYEVTAKY